MVYDSRYDVDDVRLAWDIYPWHDEKVNRSLNITYRAVVLYMFKIFSLVQSVVQWHHSSNGKFHNMNFSHVDWYIEETHKHESKTIKL